MRWGAHRLRQVELALHKYIDVGTVPRTPSARGNIYAFLLKYGDKRPYHGHHIEITDLLGRLNAKTGLMKKPFANVLTIVALAIGLWVVPSGGTRGQGTSGHGTLGDRFVHADRGIVSGAGVARLDAAGRAILRRADAQVAAAVAGV